MGRRVPAITRLPALLLGTLLMSACSGAGSDGSQRVGTATTTTTAASTLSSVAPDGVRAAPRWETVTTFTGTGAFSSPEFTILPTAVQWRVRYTCSTGTLRITSTPLPRRPAPIVDTPCPKEGEGYSIVTGPVRISVDAAGDWKAVVDQQVETPLDEPLVAGMVQAPVVSEGAFYGVEKDGRGTAKLYRLPDGRRFLRLENFETSQNTDLFVWLSQAARPATSKEVTDVPRIELGNLKSTLGTQNYEIPASVPDSAIRSIVIWCAPLAIAYTAANLLI